MCFYRWMSFAILSILATTAIAQSDDLDSTFMRVTPEVEVKLRADLAEPVPVGVLNTTLYEHFRGKRNAADKLGDMAARIDAHKESLKYFPSDSWIKSDLSGLLREVGDYEGALTLQREIATTEKNGIYRVRFILQLASTQFTLGEFADASKNLNVVSANIKSLETTSLRPQAQRELLRAKDLLYRLAFELGNVYGKAEEGLAATLRSVETARDALKLTRSLSAPGDSLATYQIRNALEALGYSLSSRVKALRVTRHFVEAEQAAKDFVRLSQEETLDPRMLAEIYQVIADLRMDGREFGVAADMYAKAAVAIDALGFGPLHPPRVRQSQNLSYAFAGLHRWRDALNELNRIDSLASADTVVQKRIRFPLIRGYTYLGNGVRLDEASNLFEGMLRSVESTLPESHFQVVESKGLLGTTLWRKSGPDRTKVAIPLLREAVRGYMLPDNVEAGSVGIHKDIRELVFSTFVEALFQTPSENLMDAMAPADWIRGGSVQAALIDAAVRSSTNDPRLAETVRQDQDAKNEIAGLRKFLAGDEGSSKSPLPVIAAKMRARIAELESLRVKLQEELKAGFPDYDRLIRPKMPEVADIVKGLRNDEALLMLLPTSEAVFVWAVGGDAKSASVRIEMPASQVSGMVQAMRKTLDLGEMGDAIPAFNSEVSSALYQSLLTPVQSVISNKKHLIVAAGGALGSIPFGVLLTKPYRGHNSSAPWLIQQAAITHVPSLSAWLAVKQLGSSKSATEPLAAWGDPQFSVQVATDVASKLTRKIKITRNASVVDLEKEPLGSAIRYSDIPALPETRDELVAIATVLRADVRDDLRLGKAATKSSVLQSNQAGLLRNKRVLAFATHGLMAGDLPGLNQPALALAAIGNESTEPLGALLTLDDVLGLKLNADWVILSACNTAAGDGKAEEALSGLARGFFYAGSRSLLVTHWAVESESAKLLTTKTMAHYNANSTERKAESLRQAMLEVMHDPQYSHPAYWAPYALVGDGGR